MKSPEFCTAKLAIFPEIARRPKDPLKILQREGTRYARHLPYRVHRPLTKSTRSKIAD